MLGFVTFHRFLHGVRKLLVVLTFGHINEVDANNAAHVPQSQNTGNFFAALQIGMEGVFFLILGSCLSPSTIHINDVHRFGLLDDQISTTSQIHLLAECGLDLPMNGQRVEQIPVFRDLHNALFLRCDALQISFHLIGEFRFIHPDTGAIRSQNIAKHSTGFIQFTQHPLSRLGVFQPFVHFTPSADQVFQIGMQIRSSLFFSHRPYNDSKSRRTNRLHQSLQPRALFFRFYSSRERNFLAERY